MEKESEKNPKAELPQNLGWKHPYVIYIVLTLVLFGFMLLMAYLAIENDWIPKR